MHEVTVSGFRMGRFPVTVHEFGDFLADTEHSDRKDWIAASTYLHWPDDWERQKEHPNWPVVGVTWFEAAAYCSWKGGRLPSEAEWERAARGRQGAKHPWVHETSLNPSHANHAGLVGHPTPVGLFPEGNTPEGLCDMLGNVYEWCADWFGGYDGGHQTDPSGPKIGDERVLRGGSWGSDPKVVRVSSRYKEQPMRRRSIIGFRCAASNMEH